MPTNELLLGLQEHRSPASRTNGQESSRHTGTYAKQGRSVRVYLKVAAASSASKSLGRYENRERCYYCPRVINSAAIKEEQVFQYVITIL